MKYSTKSVLAVLALAAVPALASATTINLTHATPQSGKNVRLNSAKTEFSLDALKVDRFNTSEGSFDCDTCSVSFTITASDRDTGIGDDVSTFANLDGGTYDFSVNGESYTGDIRNPNVVITTNDSETESVFKGGFFLTAPAQFVEEYNLAYNGDIGVNFMGSEEGSTRVNNLTFASDDTSGSDEPAVSDVPEPSSLVALGFAGLLMVGGLLFSRNRQQK